MLNIKSAVFSVVMFVSVIAGAAEPTQVPQLKGYKEWKAEKLQIVINRITATKALVTKAKAEANIKNSQAFERQLSQENWNLEIANDLSVTDYFVLYLTQQNQPDRFLKAASKLTATEVAELMEAYSKTLAAPATQQSHPAGVNLPSQATSFSSKGL